MAYWKEVQDFMPAPGQGYGIRTGADSGVFVVDVDGEEAGKHLASLGALPPTLIVRTGRPTNDGYHLYFKYPTDGRVIRNDRGRKLGHVKLDVRGEGGFVVGPGSPHVSGSVYTVVANHPPADAPEWLLAMLDLDTVERREASVMAPVPVDPESDEGKRRVTLAIEYLAREAAPAIEGENGSGALWLVAQTLIRTYELPLELALELVTEVYNPRCVPPWEPREIIHKLEDARDRGTWMCGIPSEGWVQGLVEAAHRPTRMEPRVSARRKPRPDHTYTFTPGDRPNGDKKKISFATAVAELVTHPEWDGVWQFDEFSKRFVAVDPPVKLDAEKTGLTKSDGYAIAAWFEVNHQYIISGDVAFNAAMQAAARTSFHPVKEYLDSVGMKKTGILDTLATRVLGATTPLADEFLKKTLVAAVRRIRRPGCRVDTTLILYGGQGARKTTFIQELFGEQFVRAQLPSLETKDASQALNGFWAIELAELKNIINAENTTVKEFLTRTFDDYRPPYERVDMRFPRQCVFIGTTNESTFLFDPTGNRRYLPIKVGAGKIDIEFLVEHRDEIWAEANALEAEGYEHWFEDEAPLEAVREEFVHSDPLEEAIVDFISGQEHVTATDVYRIAVMKDEMVDLSRFDKKMQMRIGDTLRKLGCKSFVRRIDGKPVRLWRVSDELQKATPSAAEIKRRVGPYATAN